MEDLQDMFIVHTIEEIEVRSHPHFLWDFQGPGLPLTPPSPSRA